MNRKVTCALALVLLMVFSAYAQQYDDESDFKVEPIDGGAARITSYLGTKQEIRIPPRIQGMTVTEIGTRAFNSRQITSVIIPNSMTTIGARAFAGNPFASVSIPGATSIGRYAFGICDKLTSVSFPKVTSIGPNAFQGCGNLVSVSIPAVTSLEEGSFYECYKLASVTLGTVTSANFSTDNATFPGNLRSVYFGENGGAGTYVTDNPGRNAQWRKQ